MRNRGRKESGDGDYRMMNIDDSIMIVDTVECRRGSRSRIDSSVPLHLGSAWRTAVGLNVEPCPRGKSR